MFYTKTLIFWCHSVVKPPPQTATSVKRFMIDVLLLSAENTFVHSHHILNGGLLRVIEYFNIGVLTLLLEESTSFKHSYTILAP